jgi:hypothetical protein
MDQLNTVFDYTLQGHAANLHRAVLRWIIVVPAKFVQLLFDGIDTALAVFAHWLVMTVFLKDLWWMKGFGSSQIRSIAKRFQRCRSDHQPYLEWPLEMLKQSDLVG